MGIFLIFALAHVFHATSDAHHSHCCKWPMFAHMVGAAAFARNHAVTEGRCFAKHQVGGGCGCSPPFKLHIWSMFRHTHVIGADCPSMAASFCASERERVTYNRTIFFFAQTRIIPHDGNLMLRQSNTYKCTIRFFSQTFVSEPKPITCYNTMFSGFRKKNHWVPQKRHTFAN